MSQPTLVTSPTTASEAVTSTDKPRVVVPAIDGFRGLAALTVVLYHCVSGVGRPAVGSGSITDVLTAGYVGVDFFFVISGFVLFLPTVLAAGRFGNVRAYGIRRAARIIPAYYVALIAAVVLQPLLSGRGTVMPWHGSTGALSFLGHLTFLQHSVGLLRGYPEGFLALTVIWTLTLEAMFYLVLPFVASWYFRHPFIGFAIALVASVAWKLTVVHASFSVGWLPGTASPTVLRAVLVTQLPTFLAHFAAGMTAAWLFVKWRSARQPWLPWVAVVVQVASLVTIVWWMHDAGVRDINSTGGTYDHWTATLPVALAFAALILATVLAPRWARFPVTNRPARAFGDISYGVYLWHTIVIAFALITLKFSGWTTASFFRLLAFTLVCTIVVATLSLVFVERPCIRWARRCTRRIEKSSGRRARRDDDAEAVEAVTPANAW